MPITQEQWNLMSGGARADYLRGHEIRVKTQTFLDGSSKVGNANLDVGRMAVALLIAGQASLPCVAVSSTA